MKKILFIIMVLLVPFLGTAQSQTLNLGIVQGIWFSEAPFFEGEKIRVYAAVQNNSGKDIDGRIEFFQGGASLGSKSFSALDGRIIESWIDTRGSLGEQEFSVRLLEIVVDGEKLAEDFFDTAGFYSKKIVVVKKDTDGDKIPDDIDSDDDGDGIEDGVEISQGSDPLDKESVPVADSVPEKDKLDLRQVVDEITHLFKKKNSEMVTNISTQEEKPAQAENKSKSENLDQISDPEKKDVFLAEELKALSESEFVEKINQDQPYIKKTINFIDAVQEKGSVVLSKQKSQSAKRKDLLEKEISSKEKVGQEIKQHNTLQLNFLKAYNFFIGVLTWLFSFWWFVILFILLSLFFIYRLMRITYRFFHPYY